MNEAGVFLMNNNEDNIILYNSDEVASHRTGLSGWVDRHGRYWGNDEHMARWSGCTHRECSCGNIYEKAWIKCPKCIEKDKKEKYDSYEEIDWDGETPLYSHKCDEYFFDEESLFEYVDEYQDECDYLSFKDMQLVICKPNYLREIDSEYFCDDLPEDGELDNEMLEAIDKLNEIIKKQPPVSWRPGNKKPKLSSLDESWNCWSL